MASAAGGTRSRAGALSQSTVGKVSVPLMEATPGCFQGPKISHSTTPWDTKLSPSPAKISLTPPLVLRNPATAAHSAPPSAEASRERTMNAGPNSGLSLPARSAQVVKTAPSMTWPSTPMFQRPIRKVNSSPQAQSVRGIQTLTTWVNLVQEPSDPRKS